MKKILSITLSSALALGLGSLVVAADAPKAVGDGEGQVDIVAWPGYIERGETDKAYDWVTSFEKDTGCFSKLVTQS
jgi:putative spermidine/putrescine transport system substrate-binding protein